MATTPVPEVDVELRLLPANAGRYPVDLTIDSAAVTRGWLAVDLLPWVTSSDRCADGQRLYQALLADPELRETWGQAAGRGGRRRLRLWLDQAAPELHALPWELLHDGQQFLAAQAATSFSRYLPVNRPWGGATARPLRVLAAVAAPEGLEQYHLSPLDAAAEQAALQSALGAAGTCLEPPVTLTRLEAALRAGEYQALHLIAHGKFDTHRRQATLYLADDQNRVCRVKDEELAGMVGRLATPPALVFLAACESATRDSGDAFQGLAPRLVQAGVPAVVAMAEAVTIEMARTLSQVFYERLGAHGVVDLALNEARSTLVTQGQLAVNVPVLFMRLRHGQLWATEVEAATPGVGTIYNVPLENTDETIFYIPPKSNPQIAPQRRFEVYSPAQREAYRYSGAELRAYPQEIADLHLEREEVAQIVDWVTTAEAKERLGMLVDMPGSGKTVVMADVLCCLEERGIPVLVIKGDLLSGLKTRRDLAERLGLPDLVEEYVQALSAHQLVVVLLDQLDALSLCLARDQTLLDLIIDLIAHLRDLENVRLVATCRTFELHNDQRLSTIKIDKSFALRPLTGRKIEKVLQVIGIDFQQLLPEHQQLLTVPLHLQLYSQIVKESPPEQPPETYHTLQDLYNRLWQLRVAAVPPELPTIKARTDAIYCLVDFMQTRQQLQAPEAVLDDHADAAQYLERVALLRRERGNWQFSHQTFFDYCYARRFVAQSRSLSQQLLTSPQGLFERSQMIQVLAYLRGADPDNYYRELERLLFATRLRGHLLVLLLNWLGALTDPTTQELQIVVKFMRRSEYQGRFLLAAGGNSSWFDLLNIDFLPQLLESENDNVVEMALRYLGTVIQKRTQAVLVHLRYYQAKSVEWDQRIVYCLSRLEVWDSPDAVEFLCDLLQKDRSGSWGSHCLYRLAHSNPAAGCRALRAYLEQRFDSLRAQGQTTTLNHWQWPQQLLGEYVISEVLEAAIHDCPEAILEHLLPWFIKTARDLTAPGSLKEDYPADALFSRWWYEENPTQGAIFARAIAAALAWLAQNQVDTFRTEASDLQDYDSLAIQRVLIHAYLANPQPYTTDIFHYLTGDRRRLNIGEKLEAPYYDSSRLYGSVFRYVDAEQRVILEQMILDWVPKWESPQRCGIAQLHFLKMVPRELLSGAARDRLGQLERKFPDFKAHVPVGAQGGAIGSPIDPNVVPKMSDVQLLQAMRKYNDSGYEHPDFFKGGIREFASALAEPIKANPERFYRLAQQFDGTIALEYIVAILSGLAEFTAPAEWLFELVRRFAPRITGAFRRETCWTLAKRAAEGVPDDLLDLLGDWALHDPDPAEEFWLPGENGRPPYHGGDPYNSGVSSNRGAAIRALGHCSLARIPPQAERLFEVLEQAVNDPSTAVATCVVEALGSLLNHDALRTVALFEQVWDNQPRLKQSPLAQRFLYCTYYRHFSRVRPLIESLLDEPEAAVRQAGAQLVCLAALHGPEAQTKAQQVMKGDAALRRGAARVYARNLAQAEIRKICHEQLLILFYDPDEQVRRYAGECFAYLATEPLETFRPLIEQFIESPALREGSVHLVKYLAPLATELPDFAMQVAEKIVELFGRNITDIQHAEMVLEKDLARLPLTIYNYVDDLTIKSRAMDLFDCLLLLGSHTAQQALQDWDRR